MRLEDKKKVVSDLQDCFEKSKVLIATDYKGLDVAKITDLRRKLSEAQVEFKVVKNTLLLRASEKTDISLIKDFFKGPTAIALSYDDPVAPAKILTEFAKKNDKLEIKAGVLDGEMLDLPAIKSLAALPTREVLLAQLLSAMNAVPTSLVSALSDVGRRFVNVLLAVKDQKEAA